MSGDPLEVLIIVDVQNDFCPGGSLAVSRGSVVADAIANHVTRLETNGESYDYIVTTQDWHIDPGDHFSDTPDYIDSWPPHCEAGTEGAELHPSIESIIDRVDARFYKGHWQASYSGFEGVNSDGLFLGDWLRQKEHETGRKIYVSVVGIAYDYCVKATAIDAARQGFEPQVIYSLTAAVKENVFYPVAEELEKENVVVFGINS